MKINVPRRFPLLATLAALLLTLDSARAATLKVEAETGAFGSALDIQTLAPTTYLYPTTNGSGSSPGNSNRVTTYTLTFPAPGTYDLYARIFVTSEGGTANNDSLFVGNGFGLKSPTTNGDWITHNGMDIVGSTASTDIVTGGGIAKDGVWKWINLSKFGTGASFIVPDGALTQTLQIGAREDGLYLDAFVFGSTSLLFTVASLDAGADGLVPPPLDVAVNFDNRFQQLEGFGGAIAYDCSTLLAHPKGQEIMDLLFRDLGVDILRLRNTYGWSENDPEMIATAKIVAESRKPGNNPHMKTFLLPWSPPAYLKSNNDVNNGGTLKGGPSAYIYNDYAQWWADSIRAWRALGVDPDYVTIQNEPDQTTTYDSFRLAATETSTIAGYDKAFKAVVDKFESDFGSHRPAMWAPEHSGMGGGRSFITALINAGLMSKVDGISTHPYGEGNYDTPDAASFSTAQTGYYNDYTVGLGKPIHMTEYVKLNATPGFDQGFRFAWHIYNFLYKAHVTGFFNWTLFRGLSPTSGGIVTMTSATDYVIRPQYWFLKAYTRFTDPDWWVLGTVVTGINSETLKVSAFRSPANDELTMVLLNTSTASSIDLGAVNIANFTPVITEVFRSSENEQWVDLGSHAAATTLPKASITTVHMLSGQAAVRRQIEISRGGFVLNRRTNKIVQQITLRNSSSSPVSGPIYLALDGLSSNTSLINAEGATANLPPLGVSYLMASEGPLMGGNSVTVSLEFSVPASGGILYDPRVMAGTVP